MKKYLCGPCGYIYDLDVGDQDIGIALGTRFEELLDNRRTLSVMSQKGMF